jgi:2-polyprenyl-3-methyl-5-hydroxy-6-metoxy-1,4-benzoquinol methylase
VLPYNFKDSFADTIIAGELIEHLENPLGFLNECHRILKPGGVLIITTPNFSGTRYLPAALRAAVITDHIYCWNRETMINMFSRTNFRLDHIKIINDAHNGLLGLMLRAFKSLGPTMVAVAYKIPK